jgi:hypothetical protein
MRWARFVLTGALASEDVGTIAHWAEEAGASCTTVREACRIVGVRPRDARDLTRALYAARRAAEHRCDPLALLSISDSRTVRVFLRRAGPQFAAIDTTEALLSLLSTQQFVPSSHVGVRALMELVAHGSLHSKGDCDGGCHGDDLPGAPSGK